MIAVFSMPRFSAIRANEADPPDVPRKAVGVLRDDLHGIYAVRLEDPDGPGRADAVRVEEQHDLADHLLLGPAGNDPCRALGADAGDLLLAIGLLLDQVEHSLAEGADELPRIDRPMPRIMPEPR
jgi:hypothetical protein